MAGSLEPRAAALSFVREVSLRRFANAFLVAFAFDGFFSVLHDGLWGGAPGFLSELRVAAALLAVLLSIPTFVLVASSSSLPARILLPPVLFVWWCALGAPPLLWSMEPRPDLLLVLSGLQLLLALFCFGAVRRANGGESWMFVPEQGGATFDAKRFLGFGIATALLGPLIAGGVLLGGGAFWLRTETAGFLNLGPGGILAEERTYVRGDKTIHLIAMMHVGDESFYRGVMDAVPREGTLVLAEGVSDRDGLLADFPTAEEFGALAGTVGLAAQADLGIGEGEASGLLIEPADIDASEFSEATVQFLNAIGASVRAETVREGLEHYTRYVESQDPEALEAVLYEVVSVRNDYVLDQLAAALGSHDRFVLPWGALHMPGLEAGVLALGFVHDTTRTRPLLAFW